MVDTREIHTRAAFAMLEPEIAKARLEGFNEGFRARATATRFEYRYEGHGTGPQQRALMEKLGLEGWEFVCFVQHWGPETGRTMLFKRGLRP